jgi:iron complex outermembrane receptor protein
MAGIKDFRRLGRIFKSRRLTLQGGPWRFHSRNKQKPVPPPSIDSKQYLSTRILSLRPPNFLISFLSIFIFLLVLIFPNLVFSANEKSLVEEDEIFEMDILQLMQTEVVVTSVSKRPEMVHKAASAIYVLTGEDIRRSGAVNIMEALRMVPGVLVSKLNQNRYAISIRGFNQRLGSDKLLVLMDGRSVYSPVAAGVFWIGQDTVLEDIDRIEVIRGPGAALWGSNAVAGVINIIRGPGAALWGSNAVAGVINIITKSAAETQGGLVAGGAGTQEKGFATLRYGGKTENGFNYRLYGKYRDRGPGENADGSDAFDSKQMGQGGFRTDWQVNKADQLTVQGDYYRLESDLDFRSRFVSFAPPFGIGGSTPYKGPNIQEGANVLTRWNHTMEDSSSFQLQMYYDRLKRKSGVPFDNVVDQFDIDFQHNLSFAEVHNFIWGLNYRFINYDLETTNIINNNRENSNLASLFLHDEIQLIPKKLSLILGIKIEYNSFTDFEFQPSVRTAWNPEPNHTVWGAISRAVRLPTVSDQNIESNQVLFPGAPPLLINGVPNGDAKAEELLAYELGYRAKIGKKLNFDLTGYYYDYDNLLETNNGAFGFDPNPPPGHNVAQVFNANSVRGDIYGVELSAQWQVRRNWRLAGSYSYINIELEPFPGAPISSSATNSQGQFEAELEPKHIFNIRSYLNLPHNLEFDTLFYYVSGRSAPSGPGTFQSIPKYGRLDVRLGWKPMKNVDLSFVAQNLLDPAHLELRELLEVESETPRSFYLKATFKF